MSSDLILVFFNVFVVAMLALDLGLFQRSAHFPTMRAALLWTALWVLLALSFAGFLWFTFGSTRSLEFLTGYVVELSLSVDNVFVFILIFTYFAVPREHHHRVLFWGILGAVLFRALFIVLGATLVAKFHWILYFLGAFLIFTAVKLAIQKEVHVEPERNPFIRLIRKLLPVTPSYVGGSFLLRRDGRLMMTPLFIVLIMIETTDIAFATDSIPAIFAITRDTFIIYTSNIFAILGLRSLYFVVAGFMAQFRYLKYGLSVVLGFIGLKMLIEPWYEIHILVSLIVIFGVIAVSVLASLFPIRSRRHKQS